MPLSMYVPFGKFSDDDNKKMILTLNSQIAFRDKSDTKYALTFEKVPFGDGFR